MRNFALSVLFTLSSLLSFAQYSTPGTGVHWTIDSLLMNSGGTVLEDGFGYLIVDNLIISESDSLFISDAISIAVSPNRIISVFGYIETDGEPGPLFSSTTFTDMNGGIRIESGAEAIFRNTEFSYGGGIKCISGNVLFENCNISYQENIATSGAAIDLFEGSPMISGCIISNNEGSAISSPGNIQCSPTIVGCTIEGNNTENSNRPQINLGASGPGIAIIQDNLIVGNPDHDEAGGIAVASLFGVESNVLIQGNTIRDNRYGLTLFGNGITGTIRDNIIENNNTQGDPLLGGSGINLNGNSSSFAIISGNTITGNLWGITVQNDFQVDMGNPDITLDSEGDNTFSQNGNEGEVYALYNNTPSPIPAVNNCWIADAQSTDEDVESVIFHEVDDASLGLVDFSFYQCGVVIGLEEELNLSTLKLFPNPSNRDVFIKLDSELSSPTIRVFTYFGQKVYEESHLYSQIIHLDVSSFAKGLYIIEASDSNDVYRAELIID